MEIFTLDADGVLPELQREDRRMTPEPDPPPPPCECERRNRQALHAIHQMTDSWVIDLSRIRAILEGKP